MLARSVTTGSRYAIADLALCHQSLSTSSNAIKQGQEIGTLSGFEVDAFERMRKLCDRVIRIRPESFEDVLSSTLQVRKSLLVREGACFCVRLKSRSSIFRKIEIVLLIGQTYDESTC